MSLHWQGRLLNLGGYNHLYYILGPLWYNLGPTSSFAYYNYSMTNPQKGIWSFYNSWHDQSTMGIDPMNNISNNNKNTLCSYIISTRSTQLDKLDNPPIFKLDKSHNVFEQLIVWYNDLWCTCLDGLFIDWIHLSWYYDFRSLKGVLICLCRT